MAQLSLDHFHMWVEKQNQMTKIHSHSEEKQTVGFFGLKEETETGDQLIETNWIEFLGKKGNF